VEILNDGDGPLVLVQLVTPLTPVIAKKLPTAEGAVAPVGPDTVAVNLRRSPSAPAELFALTRTVGGALFTVVGVPDVGEDAE